MFRGPAAGMLRSGGGRFRPQCLDGRNHLRPRRVHERDRPWPQRFDGAPLKLNPDRHKDVVYKVMVEVEPGITGALQQLVGDPIPQFHVE
jgi:hypothetical protein